MALGNLNAVARRLNLSALAGKAGQGGNMARPNEGIGFASELSYADMAPSADVVCAASKWTTVLEKQVPAQEVWAFGTGRPGDPHSMGILHILLSVAGPTNITAGKYRVIATNYRETDIEPLLEKSCLMCKGAADTDKQSNILVPESGVKIAEDSYLKVQLNPDAASTVDYDEATNAAKIPLMIYG